MSIYASILAGGSGTRLWPLSTKATPKQFLALTGAQTMLQETFERLAPLAPITQTYVVTFENYVDTVLEQVPELPSTQIISEPLGRGTAASIGLAATFIAARDPQAVMGSFTADHLISDVEGFRSAVRYGEQLARAGHLVTLGIQPTYPETGYGYIQAGLSMSTDEESGLTAYNVSRFIEKPPRADAEHYIASGNFAWNAGIFLWRVDRILDEIHRHVPEVGRVLDAIAQGIKEGRGEQAMREAWTELRENVTIDNGVLEKTSDIVVIPVEIGWNDIGNWSQVATLHPNDEARNGQRVLHPGRHIPIQTQDTFVYSTTERVIATIGVENLIIVDTGEALLICRKDCVQLVKGVSEVLMG